RRNASGRARGSQHSKAPQVPCFRICSAAHRASAGRSGATQSSCRGSSRQPCQQASCGTWGGCTSAMTWRRSSWASAGCNRRISPMPGWGASSSTSAPCGHPPAGSCADNAAWPVGTPRAALRANWVARHRAGWMCSGCMAKACLLYKYTVFVWRSGLAYSRRPIAMPRVYNDPTPHPQPRPVPLMSHTDACESLPAADIRQLFILLHGVGGTPQDMQPLAQALRAAFPQAAILAPAGFEPYDGAAAGRQWFSVSGVTDDNRPERVARAMPALVDYVRGAQARFG